MHFFEAVGAVQPWGSGVGTTGSWRMFAIAAMIMDAAMVKPPTRRKKKSEGSGAISVWGIGYCVQSSDSR